jgi:protein-S-isoprenylcysteine O-methyltransferase Ste14
MRPSVPRLGTGAKPRCVRSPAARPAEPPLLLVYAAVIAVSFHVFVVLYEEPTLRRQFGAEYETYCRAVPPWIPRLRPAPGQR